MIARGSMYIILVRSNTTESALIDSVRRSIEGNIEYRISVRMRDLIINGRVLLEFKLPHFSFSSANSNATEVTESRRATYFRRRKRTDPAGEKIIHSP